MNHFIVKKTLAMIALLAALGLPARAGLYNFNYNGPFVDNGDGPGVILNGTTLGLTDAHGISTIPELSIVDVVLTIHMTTDALGDVTGLLRMGNTTGSPYVDFTPNSGTYTLDINTLTSSFDGLNPNNTWTLFLVDSNNGPESTLLSWSLAITAVPEPVNVALLAFGGLFVLVAFTRTFRHKRTVIHRE